MGSQTGAAQRTGREVANSKTIDLLARLGYIAKGIVYVVIGVLALLLVTGHGGSLAGRNEALKAIYDSPLGAGFGRVLMVVLTVGFFAFALWSLIQAAVDTEHHGHKVGGILARIGYAGIGISYAALGVVALKIALAGSPNASSGSSTQSTQNWTGLLLKEPAGVVLVIIVGLVVLAIAGVLFYKAYSASFSKYLRLDALAARAKKVLIGLGRGGYAALGVVFVIIGIFLIVAAVKHNPNDVKGLDSALVELLKQPFGPWLVGLVALGLFAYGLYSFVEARYRKVGK